MYTRLITACLAGLLAATSVSALEVGDLAPDFSLEASDGKTYRLSEFRGESAVVVAWFPRAFTRGCTLECRSLAENGHLLREFEVAYFMASVDPVETNREFAAENSADFPLLSDPDRTVAEAWGVLGPAGFANRHTVYIGKDGRVLAIDTDVRAATAAEDMAETLARLDVPRHEED